MAEIMIEALSGAEIIDDIIAQIRRKLQTSCDLRDADSYGQGFSAEIKISLKLYAMDVIPAELTVVIPARVEPPVSTEQTTVTPIEVEETLVIPQELDLELVRERIKTPDPMPPPDENEESRMPLRFKRKYTRRLASPEQTPMGGSVDLTDE